MREPRFWRDDGAPARLLTPLAAVYGAISGARMARPGARARVPVICVGNLTVGGAGKTPTAIAIAKLLLSEGARPFFLSRGYGGALAGPVRVTPQHRAADVGDEPLLLARVAPTVVARDRLQGAELAVTEGAGVIVMDDGFQNPSLAKDCSLVVLDGERGIGNGHVFPAGPLRAPLDVQVGHASALLVIGDPSKKAQDVIAWAQTRGLPILHGKLAPDPDSIAVLAGKKALAFAGIAHPEKFFDTLAASGIAAPVKRAFADHHPFTGADARDLLEQAKRDDLLLLTTEKDLARMQGDAACTELAAAARSLPVGLETEPEAFRGIVMRATRPKSAGSTA
jgi:tetraacyldisaccharide 4'-kinase